MQIKIKVKKFIEYCNSLSEFDKYFWLSKLDTFDEKTLYQVYDILLAAEKKLIDIELKSIENIQELVTQTYPELKREYLPDYSKLVQDYRIIQNELTIENIQSIRARLTEILTQKT